MKVTATVRPRAKREIVEQVGPARFVIAVREPPVEGRANQAAMAALAEHLGIPRNRVRLVSGHTSRQKVFQIL